MAYVEIDILPKQKLTSGEVIRSFRIAFKISQVDICKAVGIEQAALSKIENNKIEVGVTMATRFSIFFGIDITIILFPNGIEKDFKDYKKILKNAAALL